MKWIPVYGSVMFMISLALYVLSLSYGWWWRAGLDLVCCGANYWVVDYTMKRWRVQSEIDRIERECWMFLLSLPVQLEVGIEQYYEIHNVEIRR